MSSYDIVVPTTGRPTLKRMIGALGAAGGELPGRVLVVDDRPQGGALLALGPLGRLAGRVKLLEGGGHGPAAARNRGWRASDAEWVAFLDDDVVPDAEWMERLARDLAAVGANVAGSQGRVRVPLAEGRRPTDWERNVAGLESACWATADMAYRRAALLRVGGFDERFQRAYREDADLALRMRGAGYALAGGSREVSHPVGPSGPWVSLGLQAGNADDVLMRALHGPGWRVAAGAPAGRRPRHAATSAAALMALLATPAGARRSAALAGLAWVAGTAELAWARIAPGPRDPRELATMLATSVLIPPLATAHAVRGLLGLRRRLSDPSRAPRPLVPEPRPPAAVFLDRDGTLIVDVPYNGDPARVQAMPGARAALDRLRGAGVRLGVVSNQSGVARGLLSVEDVVRVNERVEELLGPLGTWAVCPHGPDDACGCRKPAPGLVLRAAAELGVDPRDCAVVGDIGADVGAATAAGARGVLVPTPQTRAEEVRDAGEVARDLGGAVDLLLGGRA